jgi:hypothetical protein
MPWRGRKTVRIFKVKNRYYLSLMQLFEVTFSRNPVTVLILVTVPLILAVLFITPLLLFPGWPDWLVLPVSMALMVVAILIVIFIIKKWGSEKSEVSMNAHGITIRLLRRSVFYSRREYAGSWEDLENVGSNFDPQYRRRFYTVRFRQSGIQVTLTPADKVAADTETPFGEALLQYISNHNSAHPQRPIRQQSMYDTWWAKGLTGLAYIAIAAALITRIVAPERMGFGKLLQVLAFSVLWLSVYYANKGKKVP